MIVLTNQISSLQWIPNHVWEGFLVCGWSGKLNSIIFAFALLYLCRKNLTTDEVWMTFQQNPGSFLPACMVILILAVWAFLVGIDSSKGKPDLQTLIYLAIMPGLNEEMVFRGFLLGILNKIMPARHSLLTSRFGWGVIITSLMFGLLHGFWIGNDLSIHIEVIAFRNAFFSGLFFGWLREKTGSLLMPVIAHDVEDFLFFFPRML